MKVRTHRFNGIPYDVDLDPDMAGYCENPKKTGNPCLFVGTRLDTKEGLKHLIHEMIHACRFSIPEDNVGRMAEDMSRLLWRLNFRKRKDQI